MASALNDSTRELGSALGVALLGAILSAGYREAIAPHLANVPPDVANEASRGIATALSVAPALGDHAAAFVRDARQAFVEGWAYAMWISVGVMGALFAYVLVRGPRATPTRSP